MPLSPQHRRREPHAAAVNHALANADQTWTEVDARLTEVDARLTEVDARLTEVDIRLTKVDARLTEVDKTCHRQPPPQPKTSAKHSESANPTVPTTPSSTFAVNPSAIPAPYSGAPRTNLNKPEQTRTAPNAPTR